MTDQEINKEIAESVGWRWHDHPDTLKHTKGWTLPHSAALNPTGELVSPNSVPDFCSDLNAMHEVENRLTDDEHLRFRNALCFLVIKTTQLPRNISRNVHSAKARQRAEAYLRTIGKWKE